MSRTAEQSSLTPISYLGPSSLAASKVAPVECLAMLQQRLRVLDVNLGAAAELSGYRAFPIVGCLLDHRGLRADQTADGTPHQLERTLIQRERSCGVGSLHCPPASTSFLIRL